MLRLLTLHCNKKESLKTLKDSLLPALSGLQWDWYIKDNGSIDGSVDEIKSWNHPNIHVIAYPNNKQNYSQGMNFLFNESGAKRDDIILTLNNDIIFNDEFSLKNMMTVLCSDKTIGLVGAKLNYTETDKIQHCGVLFHPYNGLPYHFRAGQKQEERDKANREYPAVTGAVTMLTAETYANCHKNKNGNVGFSESYNWSFEDIDLCMQIKHHLKKKIIYCGKTNISHEESASLKKNPINKLFGKQNAQLFLSAWHKQIDTSLGLKYAKADYNLYSFKK